MSIFALSRNIVALALPSFLLSVSALADPPQLTEHATAIQGLNLQSVSLPRAIGIIETKTGGKVMDIQVSSAGGQTVYDAVVVKPGKVGNARLSGRTGAVSAMQDADFSVSNLNWHDRADVSSFSKATVPLATAVKTVEQSAGGATAVNAGLAKPLSANNSVLAYNIEVVKDGRANRVAIDANTGEVIADPGALGLGDRDPGQFLP
jgi:uncharacterized membrane protein YkoI